MWFMKSNFQHFTIESNNDDKKKNNSKGKYKSNFKDKSDSKNQSQNSEDKSDSEKQSQNSEECQKDEEDQEDEYDPNSRNRSVSLLEDDMRPDFHLLTTQRTGQIDESLYRTNDQYSKRTLFSLILP